MLIAVRPEVINAPTAEGKRRYAPAQEGQPAGYYRNLPCTCDGCLDCQGGCGCAACEVAAFDSFSHSVHTAPFIGIS
jgi:hypothetical protein